MPESDVPQRRLYSALATAAHIYANQLTANPTAATDYLYTHGIEYATDPAHGWQLGYASNHWTTLVDHLQAEGFTDHELTTAGLAFRHHGSGHLLDRFRGRLMFPITDRHNRVVAFTARDLTGNADAKWINSPETPLYRKSGILYGLGQQLHQPPPGTGPPAVVVVEGAADVLAIHRMAHAHAVVPDADRLYAVAPCGTHLTADHIDLLQQTLPDARLIIAFDNDDAGSKALSRTYPIAKTWPGKTSAVRLPTGYDPADMLTEMAPSSAINEIIGSLQTLAQAEMNNRITRLYDDGRITKPDQYATDRLLVYHTIAELFIDEPQTSTAMAQAAADQLGLDSTDVARGVLEALDHTTTPPGPDPPTTTPATARRQSAGTATARHDGDPTATFAWARIQPAARRVAIQVRHDHERDVTAWVIADPIGSSPEAARAASTAATTAIDATLTHGPAAGLQAARDALNNHYTDIRARDAGDASIIAITAHPHPQSPHRLRFHIAWAGDIRAHTLHHGQLSPVTLDHTIARQHHDAGTAVPAGHIAHHLLTSSTRAGDISVRTLEHGTLLICTKAIHHQVTPARLATELAGLHDTRNTVDRLAETARRHHRTDGLVLAIHPTGAPPALVNTTPPAAHLTAASFSARPTALANTAIDQMDGTAGCSPTPPTVDHHHMRG